MAKVGEVEKYVLFTMVADVGLFVLGAAFDPISAKLMIQHNAGWGTGQILWMALFGVRVLIDWYYLYFYKV